MGRDPLNEANLMGSLPGVTQPTPPQGSSNWQQLMPKPAPVAAPDISHEQLILQEIKAKVEQGIALEPQEMAFLKSTLNK